MRLVACHRDRFFPMRLTSDDCRLAEEVLTTRVHRQPVPQNSLNKCRQGHAPGCTLSTATLFLAQEYGPGGKVHIIHSHPQQLAPPGPRVGSKANHRVQKQLRAVLADVFEQLIDLGPLEE
jgi:hypothetical protein